MAGNANVVCRFLPRVCALFLYFCKIDKNYHPAHIQPLMSRPPTPRAGGKLPPVVRAASQAVDHRRPLRGQRRHDEQDEQDVHDVQDEQDYPSASPPPLRSSTLCALRYRWPVARLFLVLPPTSGFADAHPEGHDSFRVAVPGSPPPLRLLRLRRLCRREKVLILHLGRNVAETSKRGFAPPCG